METNINLVNVKYFKLGPIKRTRYFNPRKYLRKKKMGLT